MPAWLFGGARQRTKRLEKSASEGDTRIDDYSGGSLQTIETGSDFPIGIKNLYGGWLYAEFGSGLMRCLL